MVSYDEKHSWLANIVRKHRKSFQPIRHLLMMRFLAGSPSNFFENNHNYLPFGTPPWPCLNADADHYLKPVVNEMIVTHCGDSKRPVGTFTCSCGFIYSRRGPDSSAEDRYRIGRIKNFGPVWEKKLKELVEHKQLTVREVARKLKVDDNTVKKYAKRLLLNVPWHIGKLDDHGISDNKDEKEKFEELQHKHRNTWKIMQERHKELSKTSLRKLVPATYTWLYRHNRDWLDSNSPGSGNNNYHNNRVDWEARDLQVLSKVKKIVKEMLQWKGKPERITISRTGKKFGLLALLEKHIEMPLRQFTRP